MRRLDDERLQKHGPDRFLDPFRLPGPSLPWFEHHACFMPWSLRFGSITQSNVDISYLLNPLLCSETLVELLRSSPQHITYHNKIIRMPGSSNFYGKSMKIP